MSRPATLETLRLLQRRSEAAVRAASLSVERYRTEQRTIIARAMQSGAAMKARTAWPPFVCAAVQAFLERSATSAAQAAASSTAAASDRETAKITVLRWARARRGLERRFERSSPRQAKWRA
ncbi:MAG: hypothetical protein M3T49_09765 [Candidatus Eremiobacteraeota bacterium]|nr:hypothetical protein [Candidatus Eremiobacteraeota bacterium]